jgi:hypothetical protein
MAPPESSPNSGADLFDMAKDGTTVPEDSAKPRFIPSVARPDEYGTTKASEADPNFLGGTNLAEAATNVSDIPRVSCSELSAATSMRALRNFRQVLLTPDRACVVMCASFMLTVGPEHKR